MPLNHRQHRANRGEDAGHRRPGSPWLPQVLNAHGRSAGAFPHGTRFASRIGLPRWTSVGLACVALSPGESFLPASAAKPMLGGAANVRTLLATMRTQALITLSRSRCKSPPRGPSPCPSMNERDAQGRRTIQGVSAPASVQQERPEEDEHRRDHGDEADERNGNVDHAGRRLHPDILWPVDPFSRKRRYQDRPCPVTSGEPAPIREPHVPQVSCRRA